MNRLAHERSPYLQKASQQKIDWYPWGDEAFERASAENKPVFLSSGGVWCHWCHVMARETFSDDEVASILNEQFISIKLDRDERPDIDLRYQQAVALMGNAGGWPLSIFLTPNRRPFFGGTYFPPDDRFGRPGFRKVLRSVREFYASRTADAVQYGVRVMAALATEPLEPGDLDRDALDAAEAALLTHVDAVHGGFGKAPKFPLPGALEFLLRRAAAGSEPAAAAVRTALDAMAKGGFHDQLAGGFHRYSVDEGWYVPHFEKMADDNAWLLRIYLDAYGVLGDERYREVAEDIIRFVRDVLSDPGGGFFASQDADVTSDDEGGYFTWTAEEFERLLTADEYRVMTLRFFHERGRMHHAPEKLVLCQAMTVGEIASELGMPVSRAQEHLGRGMSKLLQARKLRVTPFIDRTLYTSLNGMFITSFLTAYRMLDRSAYRDFALKSLDEILTFHCRDGGLLHAEGVAGMLEDQVHLIEALIAAYEATGEHRYLDRARELMDDCLRRFGDPAGGFLDTEHAVLGARLKRIEDIPHPSGNGMAIRQLLKLFHLTGEDRYRSVAEAALRIFATTVHEFTLHAGAYYCGLDAWFHQVKLLVEADPESELARASRRIAGSAAVIAYGADRGRVVPCVNQSCAPPESNPGRLGNVFASLMRSRT